MNREIVSRMRKEAFAIAFWFWKKSRRRFVKLEVAGSLVGLKPATLQEDSERGSVEWVDGEYI